MSPVTIMIVAGIVALIFGMVAGYFIGKPQQTAAAPGILGSLQSTLGIKL